MSRSITVYLHLIVLWHIKYNVLRVFSAINNKEKQTMLKFAYSTICNSISKRFTRVVTFFNRKELFLSSLCQRQGELVPSLGVRRPLNLHILIVPLKPFNQINRQLGGSINGRSSIEIPYFVPIR